MSLFVVVAAYNEADLIGGCVDAIATTGIPRSSVHVFDGAWTTSDGKVPFDGAEGPSTDDTLRVAVDAGAQIHDGPLPVGGKSGLWHSQAEKRTAMFHLVGAKRGDQILVLDADELLRGELRDVPQMSHALLLKRDVGAIDLPGLRGRWPKGDWSPAPYPQLRLFQWRPRLRCVMPGWYESSRGHRIVAYNGAGGPALPVVRGLTFDHEPAARPADRIDAKRAYYEAEHPLREVVA